MAGEQRVKEALGLGDVPMQEIGVFPAPPAESRREHHYRQHKLSKHPAPDLDAETKVLIGEGRNVTTEPRIGEVLRHGHASRLDADPRVIILEDIPEPESTTGPVTRLDERHWVVDSRGDDAAAMLLKADGKRIALWAAYGEVRMFELRQ